VLLFTGGAGSWKRRLVAGDAEVEPEDDPCSVRGFMGPDILSVLDLGLRGDELAPLLLAFGPAGGKWRAAGRCARCRLLAFSAAHLYHPYGFQMDWGFRGQLVVVDLVEGSSVVGGGIVEGQALFAQGRPGLDPGVVVGTILAISVTVTTGLLLEVVLADLRLLVMCNAWSHIQHVRRV